jgi:plasmid stabilization system protein ParE
VKAKAVWRTATADRKLKEIYVFSLKKWGKKIAADYLLDLEGSMQAVASGSKHAKMNPNFSTRFSYITYKKHHIFFEFVIDKLIVVTLSHVAMSVTERLEAEGSGLIREIKQL